jgi:hypothetical protein
MNAHAIVVEDRSQSASRAARTRVARAARARAARTRVAVSARPRTRTARCATGTRTARTALWRGHRQTARAAARAAEGTPTGSDHR